MTPAELRTIRDALGVSADWVAGRARVTLRSVRSWESGRKGVAVPADVAAFMTAAWAAQRDYTRRETARIRATGPHRVTLLRYRSDQDLHTYAPHVLLPAVAHGIAQLYIADDLHHQDAIPTRVVWADVTDYRAGLHGRDDTPDALQEWADNLPWGQGE